MAGLKTAWELAVLTKEPHSVIRVRNLQANVQVGTDAWGRNGKTQPVLISVSASLREPFDTASTEDMVNNSTIHYGILGKAILEATGTFGNIGLKQIGSPAITSTGHSLRSFLEHLSVQLTGCETAGNDVLRPSGPRTLEPSLLQTFEIEVALPKASLFGNGVSLSSTTLYGFESERAGRPHCRTLKLRGLRVPTLIGVNSNERLAKQIVVANIDLEQWEIKTDCYTEIEEIVVKTIEEASFQTLEALSNHIGYRIIRCFIIPKHTMEHRDSNFYIHAESDSYKRIRVCLEKPTAVTFADAPAVELLVHSSPEVNSSVANLWKNKTLLKGPPFPLQSRLNDWVKENKIPGE